MSLIESFMSRIGFKRQMTANDELCNGCDVAIQDGKIIGSSYDNFSSTVKRPVMSFAELDAAYRQISCVGSGVDLIADNIQMIEPVFWDNVKREAMTDLSGNKRLKELNDVFNRPNSTTNRKKFLEKSAKDFLVHGVVYYVFKFDGIKVNSIKILDWNLVTEIPDVENNRIGSYKVIMAGAYNGDYVFNGSYYENVNDRSLILAPYMNASPDCSYIPASILLGTGIETLLYWYGCVHNKSLLQNGARPSMVLLIKSLLNPKHREQLREEIKIRHSGAGNAGSAIIIDGSAEKDIKQFSQNNKDMEFSTVLQAAEDAVYKRLGVNWVLGKNVNSKDIPNGMVILYDTKICPLFQAIFNHIFDVFKYKNAGFSNICVFYLEQDIPALRPRFLSMMKDMPNLGIFTIQERRKMYNFEPLGDDRDNELTVQTVKVTQSGMTGTNDTEFTEE